MCVFKGLHIIIWTCICRFKDSNDSLSKKQQQACALLTSRLCVAKFTMGYFSGGLLWHVDLITDDKECGALKWQALTASHSHSLSDNNNKAASGELGACTVSHLAVLKECFRWVKPFLILKWSTGSVLKLDLGFGIYWQEWILYFSFFI